MKIICGMAGTGKSTYLASLIQKEKRSFVVLAATHSAVENIYKITKTVNRKKFFTLYAYFRIDYKNNIVKGPINYVEVIYIDEFSLLNKYLFETCIRKAPRSEFIICGDPLQLNAIYTEDESITFKDLRKLEGLSALAIEHYHLGIFGIQAVKKATREVLSKIYRQEDDVKKISDAIFINQDKSFNYPFIEYDEIIRKLLANEGYIILASKYSILQDIFSEYMLASGKVETAIIQNGANGFTTLYLYKNMELLITENTESYYNGQRVFFLGYQQKDESLYVQTEDGVVLKVAKVFNEFPLIPSNLLTIHKSQGMTLDKVILCIDDLFDSAMLYTALTRAKKEIHFYSKCKSDERVSTLFNNAHVSVFNELKRIYYDQS